MAKKVTLKKRTIFDNKIELYYSGFALTDNKNFCQFFVKKFPKLNHKFKKFNFFESDLIFSLDKEITPVLNHNYAIFEPGKIELIYFNHFVENFKEIRYFLLKEFRGKSAQGKIMVFDSEKNKPIGLLNLEPN